MDPPSLPPPPPSGTVVLPSSIPEAGEGLFATRDWKVGEVLGEYIGPLISLEETRSLTPRQLEYLYEVEDEKTYIDGSRPENFMGKINAVKPKNPKRPSKREMAKVNVKPRQQGLRIHYKITKKVPKGTEFLTTYGPNYW